MSKGATPRAPRVVTVRGSRRYKRIVAELKAQRLQPCMRCGQRINYSAPRGAPDSFSAGHIKSWRDYPELREDPANFQQEHLLCNQDAGPDDDTKPGIGRTSEDW